MFMIRAPAAFHSPMKGRRGHNHAACGPVSGGGGGQERGAGGAPVSVMMTFWTPITKCALVSSFMPLIATDSCWALK